jgi:hypothetical protein
VSNPPVAVLRTEVEYEQEARRVLHLGCPGCGGAHRIIVEKLADPSGPLWEWDGSLDAPTLSPSILVQWTWGEQRLERRCHSFLRAGRWEFLADCTHELAGQTAAMKPVPDWLVAEASP